MSRVVLIGCGKEKRACVEDEAQHLYTGPMFLARRAYAMKRALPWWIVSAQYGLIDPERVIRPYDLTVSQLSEVDRAAWALCVVKAVLDELPDDVRLRDVCLELHMGADYAEPLVEVAQAVSLCWDWPVRGLGIGQQRAWYREATRSAALGIGAE